MQHGIRPMELELPAFLDLVHYYRLTLVDDPEEENLRILEIDQKHAVEVSEVIRKVEQETGIKKPAWFPSGGITIDQLQAMRK